MNGFANPCPSGTYQDEPNQTTCKQCPPGVYCEAAGSETFSSDQCADGYFCEEGAKRKYPTEDPTGNDNYGACPVGHYCRDGIKRECDPGQYQDQTHQSACKSCPAGFFCDGTGLETFDVPGRECSAGSFCVEGTTSEEACPEGTYRSKVGARSSADCQSCEGGHICGAGTSNFDNTNLCPVGYYCLGGAKPFNSNATIAAPLDETAPITIYKGGGDSIREITVEECPGGLNVQQEK